MKQWLKDWQFVWIGIIVVFGAGVYAANDQAGERELRAALAVEHARGDSLETRNLHLEGQVGHLSREMRELWDSVSENRWDIDKNRCTLITSQTYGECVVLNPWVEDIRNSGTTNNPDD